MRSREVFVQKYAESHTHPGNQWIHIVCVPAIVWASVALAWLVPVGRFIPGLPLAWVPCVNLGTLAALPALVFYARLGFSSFVTGCVWLSLSYIACAALQGSGLSLLWIAASTWVLAWAVQFYGHRLEGAKPSFIDDLVFLLIGPLFVQDKLVRLVTTGSLHAPAH